MCRIIQLGGFALWTWSCAWWKNLLGQMEDLGDFRRGTISEEKVLP
jgi:hypothetical protein